ncbi:Flavin-nucleotide-binding protein [Venustampulla echinocandica]|uniref:Flavin-nucleotide-binding protein n=1 Tax=Venustampulla echinocandica TaxID=2656787 RepID=A0A370TC13_9HELO|nr:Flavin-nucleotide-binding protein [Venustampulla echinocandica]RDL31793.1 Flavin-nucleotide-binding protein [Venustampulla echinocandica]
MSETEYAIHPRSTLHRHKERAHYDYGTIHKIMNTAPIWHVSFLPSDPSDPFPCMLPMLGQMASFANPDADPEADALDLYIHGHAASRLMRLPTASSQGNGNGDENEGVPVCISAAHIDSLILSLTPFNHSSAYRSAIIHGYATTVTSEDEKLFAMYRITNGLIPQRWENSRSPPTKSELISTGILRVRVVSASAKVNVGGPSDDRKDLKNEEVLDSVWTGVVPVYERLGTPVEAPVNRVKEVPAYLKGWIEERNREGEAYAKKTATMEKKKG